MKVFKTDLEVVPVGVSRTIFYILTDTDTEPQSENNASYTIIGGNDSNTNRLGEGDTENLQHLVFYLFLFIYFFVYLCFAAIYICGYQYM